jgi:nucleotide-binding universal stress UspA family protein
MEADMYKRILVAIDGSETAEHAFDSALQLAHDNAAQLQPLYVIANPLMAYDAYGYDPTILRDACVEEGERLMADALARMKHENVAGVPRIVDVAPIGEDISERIRISANDFNADLLVVSSACFWVAWPSVSCATRACRCYWCPACKRKARSRKPPNAGTRTPPR